MTRRRRLLLLLFLGIAVAALVLLAASLPQTQLLPGRPFYLGSPSEVSSAPDTGLDADIGKALEIAFVLLIWIGVPLLIASIIWAILRKKREYLIMVLMLLAWAALIAYVQIKVISNPEAQWNNAAESTPEAAETPTPTDVFEPNAPDWLVYTASAGLAVLLLVVARAVWQGLRRRPHPAELLAEEAQRAAEEISAGGDWQDIVRRCYAEMCHTLRKSRGLARQASMTPREFAAHLEEVGLPMEHIQRLTRLFETVRYGTRQAGQEEEQEAVACLSAIAELCRREP